MKRFFLILVLLVLVSFPSLATAQSSSSRFRSEPTGVGGLGATVAEPSTDFVVGPDKRTPTTLLDNIAPQCRATGDCTLCDMFKVVATFMQWLLGFIAAAALFALVWGGFDWITSAGNQEKIGEGKKRITGAILGMLIVIGAWTFIGIIIAILVNPVPKEGEEPKFETAKIFAQPWTKIKCGE